jgi:hypothetical protein
MFLQPHEVTAKKLGVGACAWEGEMLLAAYLLCEWRLGGVPGTSTAAKP